jgi:hypothetical protein
MRDTFCGQIQRARASYSPPQFPTQKTQPKPQQVRFSKCNAKKKKCNSPVISSFFKTNLAGSCAFFVSTDKIIRAQDGKLKLSFGGG